MPLKRTTVLTMFKDLMFILVATTPSTTPQLQESLTVFFSSRTGQEVSGVTSTASTVTNFAERVADQCSATLTGVHQENAAVPVVTRWNIAARSEDSPRIKSHQA